MGLYLCYGLRAAIVACVVAAILTGLGRASVFPALGVKILKRLVSANRGRTMGAFVIFLDIAYGIWGPAGGVIAEQFGYAAVYLFDFARALIEGRSSLLAVPHNPADHSCARVNVA
jgi:predicted MFS family arabinose efflux permease